MAYVDLKSFSPALAIPFLLNIDARTALLNELDNRMAKQLRAKPVATANCPEHLFSIDEDKLALVRLRF